MSVDYKPRKVVSAQFLRYDVQTATTTERTAALAPKPKPTGPPLERNVLIVFDSDSKVNRKGLDIRARQQYVIPPSRQN